MKPWRAMLAMAAMLLGAAVAGDAPAARGGGHSGGRSGGHAGGHAAGSGARGGHSGHFPGGRFVPRFRAGVFIGAPLFAPSPFYAYPLAPYYEYPAPLTAPSAPIYIEQYPGQADPQRSTDWYYCASANGYYPYVRDCAEGWQRVPSQPPS